MDVEKLKVFREVAREGSFSAAARNLYRTQPAISQSIRLLEEQLGQSLFLREGQRVSITAAGEALLEHVEQAFDELDRGLTRLSALQNLEEGTLRIATSDTTACYLLPEPLGAFHQRFPGVEVQVMNRPSPLAAEHVARREADLAIVTLPIDNARLRVETLAVREDVLICPPDHALAKKERVRFQDLLSYPLLLLDRGSNTRAFIDRRLSMTGRPAQIAMELGSIEVIKKLVQLNFGISIVPRLAVREESERGELRAIRVFGRADSRSLGMAVPARGFVSPASEVFMQMLRAHVRGRETL